MEKAVLRLCLFSVFGISHNAYILRASTGSREAALYAG